jgi:hypothetical protein
VPIRPRRIRALQPAHDLDHGIHRTADHSITWSTYR